MRIIWGVSALLSCMFAVLIACSNGTAGETASPPIVAVDETTTSTILADQERAQDDSAGIYLREPFWQLENLEALHRLLTNADGYSSYYFFDQVPPGLDVESVNVSVDMDSYLFYLDGEKAQGVTLYVYQSVNGPLEQPPGTTEVVIDGTTYYYIEELDDEGECCWPASSGETPTLNSSYTPRNPSPQMSSASTAR